MKDRTHEILHDLKDLMVLENEYVKIHDKITTILVRITHRLNDEIKEEK